MTSGFPPSDWISAKLGECCNIISGGTPKRDHPEYWDGTVPWVTPKDISDIDEPDFNDPPEKITELGLRKSSAALLPSGAVLFSSRAPIGLVAITGQPMATNQGFKSLVPGPNLDSRFLYYAVKRLVPLIAARGNGATFKEVSKSVMSEIDIAFPKDVNKQRHIAGILDKTDAIRRKREEALALADHFVQAAFLEMFGNPASNPKRMPVVPIKEIGRVITGNTPPRKNPENYGPGIEWIKSDNINTPYHFLTKAEETLTEKGQSIGRTVPAGSTLVTCIAGSPNSIGNAALADREVAFNQQINAVVPTPEVDPFFLYCQFRIGKKLVQGSSTKSMKGMVSKGKFQEIKFLNPPSQIQKAFGRLFEQVMCTTQKLQIALKDSETLFASLSQRAFRGEL